MAADRTRFLRPKVLALLPSGLWALDAFHPVAAVLEPATGAVRRVVAWPQVPPPGPRPIITELPAVHGDGTGLWLQLDQHGPLVRINEDGLDIAVWTGGLELMVCGPDVAWCRAVKWGHEPRPGDRPWLMEEQLLRVDRTGHATPIRTRGEIHNFRAGPHSLHLLLAVAPTDWTESGSGSGQPAGWVSVPSNGALPEEATVDQRDAQQGAEPDWDSWEVPEWDRVGGHPVWSYQELYLPGALATDAHRWNMGSVLELPRPKWDRSRLLATAHTPEGAEVQRWDLGRGCVVSAISLGHRVAVAVERPDGASEVLALDPDNGEVVVLLAPDTVDITGLGWPAVTRPIEADSYAERVRAQFDRLDLSHDQVFDFHATLRGSWPDTKVEWTFRSTTRPGLVLRRRVRLFDELGRVAYPDSAELDLIETVGSVGVPPADDALDGYLDL